MSVVFFVVQLKTLTEGECFDEECLLGGQCRHGNPEEVIDDRYHGVVRQIRLVVIHRGQSESSGKPTGFEMSEKE